jgi:hypothetical protein
MPLIPLLIARVTISVVVVVQAPAVAVTATLVPNKVTAKMVQS